MKNVEILLAVYNGEKYLEEQIQSIISQDTDDWHLTISDDGSTDSSAKIIESYVEKYPSKMTRVFSGKHFGSARDHFFWLMSQCNSSYIQFCDQDDIWHKDKVRLLHEEMIKVEIEYGTTVPVLVFSDQNVVDSELKILATSLMKLQQQNSNGTDYRNIIFQNIVSGCTMEINGALAALAGKCNEITNAIMHDWWLAIVATKFGRIAYLPQPTIDYRQHEYNDVGAKNTGSLTYFFYKMFHLDAYRKTVQLKKKQALFFLSVYSNELTIDEQMVLEKFSCKHSGIMFKLSFCKFIFSLKRRIGFLLSW